MGRSALANRVFRLTAALSALSILLMAAAALDGMRRLHRELSLFALERTASALAGLAPTDPESAQDFCLRAGRDSGLRVTVIGPDGRVWGDSRSAPEAMVNHLDRPEVAAALSGGTGAERRVSGTLGVPMAYAAAPIRFPPRPGQTDAPPAAALRVAVDTPDLSRVLYPFVGAAAAAAVLLVIAAGLASARLGRSLAAPVLRLSEAAESWAAGRLDLRAADVSDPEFAALAATMNAMAEELDRRIRETENRKAELGAVLASLGEGVIAVDENLRLVLANPRAAELLGASELEAGRPILRATGSADLERIAAACVRGRTMVREEFTYYGPETKTILAYAAPYNVEGARDGAVIALTDLSAIRRLERVRTDFVANVSHELRTPITLIKGFAETLESEEMSPEERARFTAIIRRHADRMASIIEDLLTLARLEAGQGGRGAEGFEELEAGELAAAAVESARLELEGKAATVEIRCPPGLSLDAHPGLVEQALVNLVANAAKYGPRGGAIELAVRPAERDGRPYLRFAVKDRGPGIPDKDKGRLFERFYRVDRARSRELGGTGLGLAIVKHIALIHGGSVGVRSRHRGGSEFYLYLPVERAAQAASPSGDNPAESS